MLFEGKGIRGEQLIDIGDFGDEVLGPLQRLALRIHAHDFFDGLDQCETRPGHHREDHKDHKESADNFLAHLKNLRSLNLCRMLDAALTSRSQCTGTPI